MDPVKLACSFGRVSVGKEKISVSLGFSRAAIHSNGKPAVAVADELLTNRRLNLVLTNVGLEGDLFADDDTGEEIELKVIAETNSLSCKSGAFGIGCNINRSDLNESQTDNLIRLAQSDGVVIVEDSQGKPEKSRSAVVEPEPEREVDTGTYLAELADDRSVILTPKIIQAMVRNGFPTTKDEIFAWFDRYKDSDDENAVTKALCRIKGMGTTRAERLAEAVYLEMGAGSGLRLNDCQRVALAASGAVTVDALLHKAGRNWIWGVDIVVEKAKTLHPFGFVPKLDPEHADHRAEAAKKKALSFAVQEASELLSEIREDSEFADYRMDVEACLKDLSQ